VTIWTVFWVAFAAQLLIVWPAQTIMLRRRRRQLDTIGAHLAALEQLGPPPFDADELPAVYSEHFHDIAVAFNAYDRTTPAVHALLGCSTAIATLLLVLALYALVRVATGAAV
jgi:hypothetical protein